jgi:hypothetical protein
VVIEKASCDNFTNDQPQIRKGQTKAFSPGELKNKTEHGIIVVSNFNHATTPSKQVLPYISRD